MKAQTPESVESRIASAPAHYRWMCGGDEARFAVVRGARTVREVEAYLPSGYAVMESFEEQKPAGRQALVVVIGGVDQAGWTLDSYVAPRLASGLMTCTEIEVPA